MSMQGTNIEATARPALSAEVSAELSLIPEAHATYSAPSRTNSAGKVTQQKPIPTSISA
jgi:hypothetical protein